MNIDGMIYALSYLYRIVEAGEKGYAVSASNVNNQALKILLRSYAQQRAGFKAEILAEILRLGGDAMPRSSIRGILHRGRIAIFAALTIGNSEREKVILKEVTVGEKIALRIYETTLKKELPVEIHKMIERQYKEVSRVVEQIHLIRGVNGKRLVVQLFDSENYADVAVKELKNAEVGTESIQKIVIHDSIELYTGKGTTVFETSISGAVGGSLWGSLIGAVAGISAEQATLAMGLDMVVDLWSLVALSGIAMGALFGWMMGYVIGTGISQDDSYLYDQSMEHGKIIILALVTEFHAPRIRQIMAQVHGDTRTAEYVPA